MSAVSADGTAELALFGQGGGHHDDMPAALREHLGDDALGEVKEAEPVHRRDKCVVLGRVLSERLGEEYAGIVHQGVDTAES